MWWIHLNLIYISGNSNYAYTCAGCPEARVRVCVYPCMRTFLCTESWRKKPPGNNLFVHYLQMKLYPIFFLWTKSLITKYLKNHLIWPILCLLIYTSTLKNPILSTYHKLFLVNHIWILFPSWTKVIAKSQGYTLAVSHEHILDD